MGAEWVIKKHTYIVSPRYSNVRENHLDPQMAVKKPENWLGRILPHGCAYGIAMFLQGVLAFTNPILALSFYSVPLSYSYFTP